MVKHHHGSVTEAISLPWPSCTSYLRSSGVVLCLSGQSRAFSCFFLFWEKRTGVGRERKSDLFSSERIATSCVIMASWPLFNVFCEAYGACARRAFTLCPTRRDFSALQSPCSPRTTFLLCLLSMRWYWSPLSMSGVWHPTLKQGWSVLTRIIMSYQHWSIGA
jgi:hypothetical protein